MTGLIRRLKTGLSTNILNILGIIGFFISILMFLVWLIDNNSVKEYEIILLGDTRTDVWKDFEKGFTERWLELQGEFAATASIPKISMRTVYGHDDPITAIDQARNLAERKQVWVFIGPSQSSIAENVIEIYKDSGKPLLLLATNPELTEPRRRRTPDRGWRDPDAERAV